MRNTCGGVDVWKKFGARVCLFSTQLQLRVLVFMCGGVAVALLVAVCKWRDEQMNGSAHPTPFPFFKHTKSAGEVSKKRCACDYFQTAGDIMQ